MGDDILSSMRSFSDPERQRREFIEQKEASWEDIAVRRLVKQLGADAFMKSMRSRQRQHTGTSGSLLTLEVFNLEFPDFPFCLATDRVYGVKLRDLYDPKHFMKSKLVQAWERAYEDNGPDAELKESALIFPIGPQMAYVAHNSRPRIDLPGLRIVYTEAHGFQLVVEHLDSWVAAVKEQWQPNSPGASDEYFG